MFGYIDDAYITASDLIQNQKEFVHDNVIKDNNYDTFKPTNIINAQGELTEYDNSSSMSDKKYVNTSGTTLENLCSQNNYDNYTPITPHKQIHNHPIQQKNIVLSNDIKLGLITMITGIIVIFFINCIVRLGRKL